MKKFLIVICIVMMSTWVHSANVTIGDLVADATPGAADLLEIEQSDNSASNKATIEKVVATGSAAYFDGTSDAATYIRLYDGNSHYSQFAPGDSSANLTWTFPTAYPAANGYAMLVSSAGVLSTSITPSWQALTLYGENTLSLGTSSSLTGSLLFKNATNNNIFTILPGVTGAALTWTLPTAAPGGANYLLNVDADGTMGYTDPASIGGGTGDVTGVGDCASGACLDGSSDGGTNIAFYDGTGNKITISAQNSALSADKLLYLPVTASDGQYLKVGVSGNTWTLSTDAPAGSGDVTGAGDCASGACYDGTSDGGTYIRLYDGNSHYTQLSPGDSAGNLTFTFPTAYPAASGYAMLMSDAGVISTTSSLTGVSFDLGDAPASGAGAAVAVDANGVLTTSITALLPDAADGATLGSAAAEWSDIYLADGGVIYFQNDQSVYLTPSAGTLTLTGALVTSGAISPSSAGGAALGSATAEWDHLYLHDAAVIYGQADQSNTLTSSATGWTANLLFTASGGITIADSQVLTFDESAANPNDADIQLSATDGVFKIAAANGDNNEDLTVDLDQTADTAIVTSSTGVSKISFSALNLVTTGYVSAGINVITDSDDHTVSATEAYGGFGVATGAGTWTLPAVAAGMAFCVYSTTAAAVNVDVDASDIITLNGTALSAGDKITSASAAGDFICLIGVSSTSWLTLGRSGTWTDGN